MWLLLFVCLLQFADDDFPGTTSSPDPFAADLLDTRLLLDRLRVLEKEKSDLVVENGNQRRQYERYLNDITSHVVHVLGAQKVVLRLFIHSWRSFVLSDILDELRFCQF